jgi:hypothetical protein
MADTVTAIIPKNSHEHLRVLVRDCEGGERKIDIRFFKTDGRGGFAPTHGIVVRLGQLDALIRALLDVRAEVGDAQLN